MSSVARFSERTWTRPRTPEYYAWRYRDAPALLGFLALDGDECLASVWAFAREYRIGAIRRTCLETHDWFCRPELRGSGLGIQVMRAMMKRSEPIVTVGGSPDTMSVLPRLKWAEVGTFVSLVLPLGGAGLSDFVSRRTGIPAAWMRPALGVVARLRARGTAKTAAGDEVVERNTFDAALAGLGASGASGIEPLADPERHRWWFDAPRVMGRFVLLELRRGGRTVAWSFSRVYDTQNRREASILSVRCEGPSPELHETMVGCTLARLRAENVDAVRAGTSSAVLETALRAWRFVSHQRLPILVWSREPVAPPPHDIGNDTADTPLTPYPEP